MEREIRRLQQKDWNKSLRSLRYRQIRRSRDMGGDLPGREAAVRDGEPAIGIAVAETMVTAAARRLENPGRGFGVRPEDLRVYRRQGAPPMEVCLLLDTSGSMNGKRINEVKMLADQLAKQMYEPLSLVTFQEGDVQVKVAATRNTSRVKNGLSAMVAAGLTPLGDGIRLATKYLAGRRGKKHLLILITDGLPTWAGGNRDPYQDAIEAAGLAAKAGIRFICIGLEPQRFFLEKLAAEADASLYIVDDLDHREMAAITRKEKTRARPANDAP